MISAIRRRLDSESGITLIEAMIVMSLLALVMTFTMRSVATFERAATGGVRRLENLEEGRLLMQVLTKDIRTAARLDATSSPFLLADDEEVLFYANLNLSTTCPKLIHLYVDAQSQLIESVTEPDAGTSPPACTYDDNTPRDRLVGQYIANATDQPIFTFYYDDSGTLTPYTVDQTPLGDPERLLVSTVGIELAIRKDTSLSVAHTTLVNKVRLPNVYYNPQSTESPSP